MCLELPASVLLTTDCRRDEVVRPQITADAAGAEHCGLVASASAIWLPGPMNGITQRHVAGDDY